MLSISCLVLSALVEHTNRLSKDSYMNVVLIGQTGSGKTTIAKAIQDGFSIPHISSGDIARELGRQDATTKNVLDRGLFAPEEAMRIQVHHKIEQAQLVEGGFVIDGFPRTSAQMIALLSWTTTVPTFIYLTCSRIECIFRLVERARDDDNADAVARKFDIFDEVTVPMIDTLEEGGILHTIESSTPSETFAQVERILEA